MTAEAILENCDGTVRFVAPAGGYAAGQVIQLTDGRAAFVAGLRALLAGDTGAGQVIGQVRLPKTASVVCLKGGQAYFNRSANTVTPLQAATGANFEIGVFLEDAASSATDVLVDLNVRPKYLIDLHRDIFEHLLVKTVVGSTTVLMPILEQYGGVARMAFGLTAEAQKLDLLSKLSVPITVPFIAEFKFAVYDIGDAAAVDINIGVANGTHASNADTITESVFFHLDGSALDLLAESDDGLTEVNATDTTVDLVDDTYVQAWIDARNLSDIQLYVAGVNVLPDSVFKLNAATGPIKLLAHIEKSADDSPGDFRVADMTLRTFEVV